MHEAACCILLKVKASALMHEQIRWRLLCSLLSLLPAHLIMRQGCRRGPWLGDALDQKQPTVLVAEDEFLALLQFELRPGLRRADPKPMVPGC